MTNTDEKIPLKEAMETLTIAEVRAIEKHLNASLEDGISGTSLTAGVAWACERRRALRQGEPVLPTWDEIEGMTLKWLNDYFAPEEVEVIAGEPESPSGKG